METSRRPAVLLGHALLAVCLLVTSLTARPEAIPTPAADLIVTGQVLYGQARGATRAAVADIQRVYDSNPAYMRMKAFRLSESSPRGRKLFEEARSAGNRALATVARSERIDVITVPGGVEGGDGPIGDVTQQVIDLLPSFCVEGQVLYGAVPASAGQVAEVDSNQLLAAIPAWQECQALTAEDARYHILRKSYLEAYEKAIKAVARRFALDAVAEKGSTTSRHGPVNDVTQSAVEALSQ